MTTQDKQDKRSKLLDKLKAEPTPVMTQVVRVPEEPKNVGRQKKEKTEPTEHFNVYLPESLASDMRLHKAKTQISIQDIVTEAIRSYLVKQGALTIK